MITQRNSTAPTEIAVERVAGAKTEEICTYLDWDSEFFGKRIAWLKSAHLNGSDLSDALTWCTRNRIDCLYFLSDAAGEDTRRIAGQNEFTEVDVRLTLQRPITPEDQLAPADSRVRRAREPDVAALRRLARTLHHESRFYFDTNFERAKCDLLYETWIAKSFEDAAQVVFVPEMDGQPVGYMTCQLRGQESQIGLLGVASAHAGTGLGRALVRTFLSWSAQQNATSATVVTQERNLAARGLYEHCGFIPLIRQRWFHRWSTN